VVEIAEDIVAYVQVYVYAVVDIQARSVCL